MRAHTSTREFGRRLTELGCVQLRSKGGHVQWKAPTGAHFTTTAAGRRKDPGDMEFKAAARALGITIEELLR